MPTKNSQFLSIKPIFQPIVWDLMVKLEAKGWKPVVAQGLRTVSQEASHVADGSSQTMHSYHLLGLAVDLIQQGEGWDKGLVRSFWWDMYQIATSLSVQSGHVRCGLVWNHPERAAIYKAALDRLEEKIWTQKQADAAITWFCDAAHIELHLV